MKNARGQSPTNRHWSQPNGNPCPLEKEFHLKKGLDPYGWPSRWMKPVTQGGGSHREGAVQKAPLFSNAKEGARPGWEGWRQCTPRIWIPKCAPLMFRDSFGGKNYQMF